jgi:hypothetical protein
MNHAGKTRILKAECTRRKWQGLVDKKWRVT